MEVVSVCLSVGLSLCLCLSVCLSEVEVVSLGGPLHWFGSTQSALLASPESAFMIAALEFRESTMGDILRDADGGSVASRLAA